MHAVRRFLVKQTISPAESMRAQLSLEVVNLALVVAKISFARQMFQPDRVQFQSAQTEHPLQRHRKIAAALEVFCRKTATEKNRHASRVINLLACSSSNISILEYPAVGQVRLSLRLVRLIAQSGVRDRRDRAKELWLLTRVQCLLKIVGHR